MNQVMNAGSFNAPSPIGERLAVFFNENARLTQKILNHFKIYPYFLLLASKGTSNSLFEAEGIVNAVFREIEDLSRANGKSLAKADQELCEDLKYLIISNLNNIDILKEIFPFLESKPVAVPETPITDEISEEVSEEPDAYEKPSLSSWCEKSSNRPSLQMNLIIFLSKPRNLNRIVSHREISEILWTNGSAAQNVDTLPMVVFRANNILRSASHDLGVLYRIVNKKGQGYKLVAVEEQ